jgi:hypothetical protein
VPPGTENFRSLVPACIGKLENNVVFFSDAKPTFFGGWVKCLRSVYNVPFDMMILVLVLPVSNVG